MFQSTRLSKKLPLSILQRTSPPFYTHQNLWLMEGTIFLPGWREVGRSKTRSWSGETCSLPLFGPFWWTEGEVKSTESVESWERNWQQRGEVREIGWLEVFLRFLAGENKDLKYKHNNFKKESRNLGLISWFWFLKSKKRLDDWVLEASKKKNGTKNCLLFLWTWRPPIMETFQLDLSYTWNPNGSGWDPRGASPCRTVNSQRTQRTMLTLSKDKCYFFEKIIVPIPILYILYMYILVLHANHANIYQVVKILPLVGVNTHHPPSPVDPTQHPTTSATLNSAWNFWNFSGNKRSCSRGFSVVQNCWNS